MRKYINLLGVFRPGRLRRVRVTLTPYNLCHAREGAGLMFYCIQAQYTKIQTKTKHGSVIVIVFFSPSPPSSFVLAGSWNVGEIWAGFLSNGNGKGNGKGSEPCVIK